ncbi:MAG TPA: hypothetical protein VGL75_03010 [Acidothermaceae bacterium]|jgi:hypothetical protein
MTQQPPDDFERRLRDVLHSRNLGVPVPPDAIDRIHAGARRRQQRRASASALGAVAIIAIAAVAIGVRPHGHVSNVADPLRKASPSPTVAAASSASPTAGRFGVASALASAPVSDSAAPLSSAPGIAPLIQPFASESAAATQPGGFTPVSVSAVGLNDYWVLGYTTTNSSDGFGVISTLEQTTDGGQHFTTDTTPPAFIAQAPIQLAPDAPTISQIRFGDAKDGWTFGTKLFSTTDAGTSWAAVNGVAGGVVDLVAANNTAWAIVQTASSSDASSPATRDQYALWSTSYGKGKQAWSPVALPISLGSTTPSIVDQDGTVTLMASGVSDAGNKVHVLIGTAGKPFTDHTGPCEQDLGGTLSNSKTAIWAECSSGGTASALYVSKDAGATWTPSPVDNTAKIEIEAGVAVGAIDDTSAVVFDAANQRLSKISGTTVSPTSGALISDVTFLGFTDTSVGFAITVGENGTTTQLLRTMNGGATWPAVTF